MKKYWKHVLFAGFCLGIVLFIGIEKSLFSSAYETMQTREQYGIVINEVMADNRNSLQADDGGYHSYIELCNTADNEVNLQGFGLTTDPQNPYMWQFPEIWLEPHAYLVVWASGKDSEISAGSIHANFKLKRNDNVIVLTSPGRTWKTTMLFGHMYPNISYGRQPDASKNVYWFDGGTAGISNELQPLMENRQGQRLANVVFSLSAGFYQEETALSLSHTDSKAEIFYTLDGSDPTEDSRRYQAPIRLVKQDTPAVVRARAFRAGYPKSGISTQTYFVQSGICSRYDIPVVSITTDPKNLFDYETGIYVAGKVYDDWLKLHPETAGEEALPANYNQKGKLWERPAHMELFEPDGTMKISQNIGLHTHGGYSLDYPNKSLRLLADTDYDEKATFDYDFFAGGSGKYVPLNGIILRNSASDSQHLLFRDAFMQSLADPNKLDIQKSCPCIAFINGEYYGIYNIRPLYSADYIAQKYDFNAEDVVIIRNPSGNIYDEVQEGFVGDELPYIALYRFIESKDMKKPENYAYVETQIDIDNYIEYNILEIYCGNQDWIANNVRIWRKRTPDYSRNAPYGQDGRWRWLVYDLDMGYGLYDVDYSDDMLANATSTDNEYWYNPKELTVILRTLLTNAEFKEKFITRFTDLLNSSFRPEAALEKLNKMAAVYLPYVQEHIDRWNLHEGDINNYLDEIGRMQQYAKYRPDYVRRHIRSYFDLDEMNELTVSVSGKGSIQINTITLESNDLPWTGMYFREFPVTLQAVPAQGYSFAGWQGTKKSDQAALALHLDAAAQLQAIFTKAVQ